MTQKNSSLPKSFLIFVLFMFLFHSVTIQIVVANEDDNETNNIEVTDSNNHEETSDNASNNSDNDQNESDSESDYNSKNQETSNDDLDDIIEENHNNSNNQDDEELLENEVEGAPTESKESINDVEPSDAKNPDVTKDKNQNQLQLSKKNNASTLEEGVRHNDVLTLKKDLQTLGFANGMSMTNYYGSYTTKKVKDLQKYYGIKQTGKADKDTLKIIKDILNSPYLPGKRHQDIIPFKEKLNATEFGGISLTNLYGSFTEKRVKAFQKKHQLVVNGIGDPVTLKKLEAEVPYLALEEGVRHNDVLTLKKDLQTLGFANGMSMTNYYGSYTTKKVKDLQKYYGIKQTGKADKDTLKIIKDILNSPYLPGKRHLDIIPFKEKLNATEFGGISLTNLYGSFTEKRVKAFQKKHQLVVNGIGDPVTLKKLEAEVPYLALEEGVRHNDVLTLKKDLQTLGFANGMSMTNY